MSAHFATVLFDAAAQRYCVRVGDNALGEFAMTHEACAFAEMLNAEAAKITAAACRANDALKQTLDALGCVSQPGGNWVNNRALEAEADLHALRCAVRKAQAALDRYVDMMLDPAERAAWTEALK